MSIRISTLGLAALCGAAASSAAWAAEYGTVISSTPVVSSAPVTQRECIDEAAAAPRRSNGAGAVVGALFGAALGNAVGGSNRTLATGVGMIAGAALGNHAEAQEAGRDTATVQRCRDVTRGEQRVVGYDVVYEYQGVRRTVRLPQQPGDRIALEVHVAPVGAAGAIYDAPAAPTGADYDRPVAPRPQPARPVYRTPADNAVYDDERPPPRTVYAPQPAPGPVYAEQPVMASPWPYLVVGGVAAWAIANHHGGRSGPPRRYRR